MRVAVALVALLWAASAAAQDAPPDPFTTARMRIGPLALTPGLALQDVGLDTNVFNQWDDPKSDFTATIGPRADFWVRFGKARIAGKTSLSYVYFAKYGSERSVNTDDSLRLELPLPRIRPYVGGSYLNTRARPGYEIDARARYQQQALLAGVDLPISSKVTVEMSGRRERLAFAGDAVFQGTYLQLVLDRDTDSLGGSLRYALTPLTTLVVRADRQQDRFRYSPIRNSDTLRVMPGVELSPFALISGNASVGYRQLNMLDPSIPDYRGVVANAGLAYTFRGVMRLELEARRDIDYSFDIQQPYYVLTGATLSVSQQVRGPWDVQGRLGRQQLRYISMAGVGPVAQGRIDHFTTYGGGVGYRIGRTMRLGVTVDKDRRQSPYSTRDYNALRIRTSVTYGY
jgi:hypothetical protein